MSDDEFKDAQSRFYRTQARSEFWTVIAAIAAILVGAGIFAGSILGLSNWIGHEPQTINVHLKWD
jgi:hypothetical protein